METEKTTYRSFLLRLWRVEQNGDWIWRCSLEETGTGWHQKFVDLEAMFDHLNAEIGAPPSAQKENKQ
ncbi:MAG: hypothetical protein ACK2UR_07560 [Candidatus Promineifilaceae bacterium]|jgi:hypothetical protein